MSEHTWTKRVGYFLVDIKVGHAWVRAEKVEGSEEDARNVARRHAKAGAVSAYRITEHKIAHACNLIDEEVLEVGPRPSSKMIPTGGHKPCPLCGRQARLMEQSGTLWAFCSTCAKALPVRAG